MSSGELWARVERSTRQSRRSNMPPHSDNRLSTQSHLLDRSRLAAARLSHTAPWFSATENDTSHLPFSPSHGISREPPRPGLEGRVEGQEVAQGGGELHVEHHHTEGEVIYSRHTQDRRAATCNSLFFVVLANSYTRVSCVHNTQRRGRGRALWSCQSSDRPVTKCFVMRSMQGGPESQPQRRRALSCADCVSMKLVAGFWLWLKLKPDLTSFIQVSQLWRVSCRETRPDPSIVSVISLDPETLCTRDLFYAQSF